MTKVILTILKSLPISQSSKIKSDLFAFISFNEKEIESNQWKYLEHGEMFLH